MHARWRRRQRHQHNKELIDLSLTPLIDVALTLLVIFIITAPTLQTSIRIALPRGSASSKNSSPSSSLLTVFIDTKKNFFFNGNPVTHQELIIAIKTNVTPEQPKAICVKADKNIPYGTILELVNTLAKIPGVSHVVFAMEQATP